MELLCIGKVYEVLFKKWSSMLIFKHLNINFWNICRFFMAYETLNLYIRSKVINSVQDEIKMMLYWFNYTYRSKAMNFL